MWHTYILQRKNLIVVCQSDSLPSALDSINEALEKIKAQPLSKDECNNLTTYHTGPHTISIEF